MVEAADGDHRRQVQSLAWQRSPGEGNVNPSILAWEIPWTEEPGQAIAHGSQRVRHNLVTNSSSSTALDNNVYRFCSKKHKTHLTSCSDSDPDPRAKPTCHALVLSPCASRRDISTPGHQCIQSLAWRDQSCIKQRQDSTLLARKNVGTSQTSFSSFW